MLKPIQSDCDALYFEFERMTKLLDNTVEAKAGNHLQSSFSFTFRFRTADYLIFLGDGIARS